MKYDLIAPCYFGTESAAAFDFKRIGAEDVAVTDGRVAFRGGPDIIAAANLWSRCAERVLILLKTYKAVTFDELFDGVSAIPWEELLPADAEFPVKGSSLSSTLSSVPACQSIVKKAVVERLKRGHRVQVLPEDGALYKIRFSIRKNMVEVMLDTSGDGLHKRGYRKNSMEAPIKETLAAAIIDLGRIYPDTLAQDPFCGSGTLMIEAAMKAMNMAPGLRRRFTAEHYAFLPAAVWKEQREKALSEIRRGVEFQGVGFDIDPAAVALAAANAKLAGVEKHCRFFTADVKDFSPAPGAMVFTNPPYGERLSTKEEMFDLYKTVGRVMSENDTWSFFLLSGYEDAQKAVAAGGNRKKATKNRKIYNGMMKTYLYQYMGVKPPARRKDKKENE